MKINTLLLLCLNGISMLTGCRHKEVEQGNIPTIKTEAAVIYGEVKTSSFPPREQRKLRDLTCYQ